MKVKLHITQRVSDATEQLLNAFSVVLIGRAGEGKTSTAFNLVKFLVDGNLISLDRCAIVFDPADLNEIKSMDIDLLFIDDIFGKHNTDKSKLVRWRNFFSTLQTFAETGRVRLILTSRMHIYKECKRELDGYGIFANALELNSKSLSPDEKTNILISQLRANDRDFHDINIAECVTQPESEVGFPLCSQQFAHDDMLFSKKEHFFAKPCKYYLEQNVRHLDDDTFITLLYVFYNSNKLKCSDLDILKISRKAEKILLHIAKLRGIEKPFVTLLKNTKDKVNNLKECYVKCINKTYSFLHDTLYEIVAIIHAEEYPTEVAEHCTFDFLSQCIRLEEQGNIGEIVIDTDDFHALAQRVIQEVIERDNGPSLSKHPMFKYDSFVKILLFELMQSDEIVREFFQSGVSFIYAGKHSFLHHMITNEEANDNFLEHAVPFLKCDHANTSDDACWMCPVKSEALAAASFMNRPDIYAKLKSIGAKISVVCLHKAVENYTIDPSLVRTIVKDLKEAGKFIDNQYLQYVLGLSVQHKSRDVFKILTDAGLQPGIDFLFYAVKICDANLLSSTITDLKQQSKMILDHMNVSRAVMESLVTDKHEMFDILTSAGAKLTDFAVYWAIVEHGFDEVVKVVRKLKDSVVFDIESYGTSHALAIAMKNMKTDDRIYQFLRSEGVIPTATVVGAMAEIGLPVCEISGVVDVLQKDGRWDSEIEERHRATAYMAACKRNDKHLKQLLSNAGVSMSPGCLSYAVVRNIDKVDHVIEALKMTFQFDSDDRNIARAFVWSVEYRDNLIYDKLVQAGVCVSMACLVSAVDNFFSSATLDKIIQELKDTDKWLPGDDFALEALNIANKRQDKAAYAKLIDEGVQWTARNLLIAVKFETIYGFEKVIIQLKRNKLLDCTSHDITSAISLAGTLQDKRKWNLMQKQEYGLSVTNQHEL